MTPEARTWAWIEKRGSTFQIALRYNGLLLRLSLATEDEDEALDLLNRVERWLRLIDQEEVNLPDDADLLTYVLSDGRHTEQPKRYVPVTLEDLYQRYQDDLPQGPLEESTKTVATHVKHLRRILGERFDMLRLTHGDLQPQAESVSPGDLLRQPKC